MESVVFQKTLIESTFDYGIDAKYEYWIVQFMNGLLNQQKKSFFHEFIESTNEIIFPILHPYNVS